jgi:hypothetical protein
MLNIAVVLFALSALGGLTLAILHFRGKNRPWPLAILHGLLAATSLALLLVPLFMGSVQASAGLKWAAGLFVVAALGGFVLFAHHLQGKRLPSLVVVVHGAVAVVAFLTLLSAVYFRG